MSYEETSTFMIVTIVLAAIISITITVLIFLHLSCCVHFRSKKSKSAHIHSMQQNIIKISRISNICTVLSLISSVISSYFSWINASFGVITDNISCSTHLGNSAILYSMSSVFKWYVFLLRLELAFSQSKYKYSRRKLIIIAILLFIWTLFGIIMVYLTFHGNATLIEIDNKDNKYYLCIYESQPFLTSAAFLTDLIVSFSAFCAFVIPIKKIYAEFDTNTDEIKHSKLKRLVLKYSITVGIASISSLIAGFGIALTGTGKILLIDYLINAICLVLMSKWYNKYFDYICCGILCCINPIINKHKNKIKDSTSNHIQLSVNDTPMATPIPTNTQTLTVSNQ